MGFDILGLNEENYFRNTSCWWIPLWDICYDVSKDSEFNEGINLNDYNGGTDNDGYTITEEKAIELNELLLEWIKDEEKVAKFIKEYPTKYGLKPDIFNLENVKDFADFCLKSGGFEIH